MLSAGRAQMLTVLGGGYRSDEALLMLVVTPPLFLKKQ